MWYIVDWLTALVLGIFGVVILFLILFVMGQRGIIMEQARRDQLILANYKADLEMVLLHSHQFDEFIKQTEEAMKKDEKKDKAVETYYIT